MSSERKTVHDRVFPKGYVEMLEQQQGQIVSGLQEMYRRMLSGQAWTGPNLSEANGHPSTHNILAALGLLEAKHDESGEIEQFEEDFEKIQSRLVANGAGYVDQRGSLSSESEQNQHGHCKSTSHGTPTMAKPLIFDNSFTFSALHSSATRSRVPSERRSYPPAQQVPLHQDPPLKSDPQLYQPPWSATNFNDRESITGSKSGMQAAQLGQGMGQFAETFRCCQWDDVTAPYDMPLDLTSCPQPFHSGLSQFQGIPDYNGISGMDLDSDFDNFLQAAA